MIVESTQVEDGDLKENFKEVQMLPLDLLENFQEGDQLIHYVVQAWTVHGPSLFDGYMVCSGSFFPEEAKIDYMRRFPDLVIKRSNVALVSWSDQTHNIDKYVEHCEEDVRMIKELEELRAESAQGKMSLELVREKLKEIRNARTNR
jgi:hypothetical protein